MKGVISDSENSNLQEVRVKLRTGFLRAVRELSGESCKILTYEKSCLQAKFSGWKPDGSEIFVQDLKTPTNLHIESALLRVPDIISITYDKIIEL
ncbi:Gem-associated protein 7 [Eumeta japonica]|uniref:Gem-associated protein 7 n=1 Tax=Eumeta variegata TaxID=151549 RepID=A0A4C1ZM82_EUMVA|nr:Gem-associated protein 7 [Eumeta japonica]